MEIAEFAAQAAAATGAAPVGTYRFGDVPGLADDLLRLVTTGVKRATAFAAVDTERDGNPPPQPGQHWILTDAQDRPHVVARTEEVRVAPLYTVDAAFAWEAGWQDRTRASWLAAHEHYLRRQGFTDLEREPIAFVRFRLVWPEPDQPHWWLPGVRELRGHEPAPDGPRPDLPALAAFADDRITGVLRFEPEPGGLRQVALTAESPLAESLLTQAFALRQDADRSRV